MMLDDQKIWGKITKHLSSEISQQEMKTWFSNTCLKRLDSKEALIEVPNKFVAGWLKDNYLDYIKKSFKENLFIQPQIKFIFSNTPANAKLKDISPPNLNTGDSFDHNLDPSFTFDNFITGKCNTFVYFLALEVANNPADEYRILYIYSNESRGKTHLLNAIGAHMLSINPLSRIKYLLFDSFFTDFSLSKKNGMLNEFREKYGSLDAILLDDIHLINGREKTQEELVFLFNVLHNAGKKIIFAGKKNPGQISNIDPQLRSRMEWGLLIEIPPPSLDTKVKIIRKITNDANIIMSEDAVFFLANSTNDLKTLSSYLVSLETHSSLYKNEISFSSVLTLISNRKSKKIDIGDILDKTSEYYGVSVQDLLSNKKNRQLSFPRQVAMYLSRTMTTLSYKEIGEAFDKRDHSTVLYAVRKVIREKDRNKDLLEDINKIHKFLL